MVENTYNARIKHKRDTSANWTSADPVLLSGEIIVVDTDNGVRTKTGDGTSKYTQLPFDDELIYSKIDTKLDKSGGTMTGDIDMGDHELKNIAAADIDSIKLNGVYLTATDDTVTGTDRKVTISGTSGSDDAVVLGGVYTPSGNNDAANKEYVDAQIEAIAKLSSISVTSPPAKTVYKARETFDPADMVISATYSNGEVFRCTGYDYEPNSALAAGMDAVVVYYTEGGITKSTTVSVTVNNEVLPNIPSQSGTLTYTGSSQSPTWSNYDSSKLTLGGVSSATNAGSYAATFTPAAGYCWSDGTTTAKTVTWTIGKAAGSLSINKTSITLNNSTKSTTITVTRAGDGAITATSSNTSVATVSVSGTTVTVNSVNDTSGTATITVKVAAGTNHTAPANKTCSVTASFKPTASTSAASGVTYTNGLSGLDAATVTLFAEVISNNSNISNTTSVVYVDFGSVHRKISVGDQVALSLNGTSYNFDVIGFNHDTLTTATAYGSSTTTGKAGITFQMHDLFTTYYSMSNFQTNSGGWKGCVMRTSTMATMKGYLPSAWQTAIKPVNKASGTGGSSSGGTETVSDSCFLLAEIEIFGSTTYSVSGEGTQYAYYKAGNSKVKTKGGSAYDWWERSPRSGDSYGFCRVDSGGNAAFYNATYSRGVAFGFCV